MLGLFEFTYLFRKWAILFLNQHQYFYRNPATAKPTPIKKAYRANHIWR